MQRPTTHSLATAIGVVLLAGAAPQTLTAQTLTLTPFAASQTGAAGAPPLVGFGVTLWSGSVGWRVSGAMDVPSSPMAQLIPHPGSATEAWQGDLDMILDIGRAGFRPGGADPRVFAGFGFDGGRSPDHGTVTLPVWSYGAGVAFRLASWIGLEAEARYRMPHKQPDRPLPPGVGAGWESRAGLSVHIGSRPRQPARGRIEPAGRPDPRQRETIHLGGSNAGVGSAGSLDAGAAVVARNTLETAELYLGTRYVWGGNSPAEGFDCSGFVRYVYAQQGITLPRVSRDQALAGYPIPARVDALEPGDLMFYADRRGVVNHVAIYAGDGRIIHSSSTGRGVRYDDLHSSRGRYYATRMVSARRVIPTGGSTMQFSESW
jgi:cell wall-associated NlpC family hydrolase